MELDGDINNPLWKHPMLYYSKDSLDKTLTTLPTEGLKKEALKMFKSCQLFMGVTMDTPSIDYHVSLAQNIVQSCLTHPVLQSELYCQLIKQTSKRPHIVGKTQPSSSSSDHSSDAHKNPVFLQGWQLLGLCTTLFLPKQKYLCYLKIHLQRHADPRNEIGKYAVFCQRSLERTIQCGGREAKPSRMEVLSLLLRNPYHHSLPMSIPVHVLNASYQVVGFDGQTTVREFIQTLNHHISMRDVKQSGFALFTNDPSGKNIEHCLQLNVKLCDVISKWERTMIETGLGGGKTEAHKAIRLTYKNRLYFRSNTKTETDKEKLLLVYQTNQDIVSGRFPINTELTLELASLLAQIEYGDYKPSSKSVEFVIEKFCPKRLQDLTADKKKQLERNLLDKWLSLSGRSLMECVRLYLTVTRKLPLFSMQLFKAKCKYGKQQEVWIGVKDDGIYILNVKNMDVLESYTYKSVESFGGCRDDFMLIPSNQSKLLFSMTKPKIIDLTNLLSSYINAVHGI
ncbi:pleckstrin homology domain-containing family H member 1-like [Saccoglossus kowalevskii]